LHGKERKSVLLLTPISKYKSSSKNKHCIAGDQSHERLDYPTMSIITGLPVKASAGLT
jgi:hypothetical protein